jgi:mono/diheme cytochrome c family protein
MIGTLWAPNLTSGAGSVTRDMAVADWLRAMRHGVAKDGHRLVLMPSEDMVNYADDDIGAIISYVKSMPPVDRADRGIHPGPVGSALLAAGQVQFAYEKIDHTRVRPVATPAPTAEWGLILSGTCTGCHGPGLSGGRIPGGDPAWPPARNLTPDETGLKGWTFEQFSNALRHGRRPDGTTLSTAMPWQSFAGMTDTDARALYAFLQMQAPKPIGGR